ncbi:MAG: LemA family protein [Candidatus Caenarcaniphilales bacterium]|nr:LemA family protein [Candidatus Caenarcaniphilales bacterium]
MIKKIPSWLIVLAVVLILVMMFSGSYNQIITLNEGVDAKWSQVLNVYQRRADLIPNLVQTVKGYASHEKETLQAVIEARAKATQLNVDLDKLNQESFAKFQEVQKQMSGSLSRLMLVIERYPDLKANQNFLALQTQLEGTENRITNERRMFNESVKFYNTYIRKIPQNLIAAIFGFEKKPYFEAEESAKEAPKVSFE